MKKLFLLILIFITLPAYSKIMDSKTFQMSADNALMLVLDTLSKLNFNAVEIQSSSGYVLFETLNKNQYLILISEKTQNTTDIKISKVKNSSPLKEIQELIYSTLINSQSNLPKRIDE